MNALELGKFIVTKCYIEGAPINNYHLQNILYVIQKKWLQTYNYMLFSDNFEAWVIGPVIPRVFYYFCCYGTVNITFYYDALIDYDKIVDVDVLGVFDSSIVDVYKGLKNPWDFVNETQKIGGAWANVYNKGAGVRKEISYEQIKKDM